MIEGKGQKWARENTQVRFVIYNSLPWVTLFLVSGWAQSRFTYSAVTIYPWSKHRSQHRRHLHPSIWFQIQSNQLQSKSHKFHSPQVETSIFVMDFPTKDAWETPRGVHVWDNVCTGCQLMWQGALFSLGDSSPNFQVKNHFKKIPPDPGTTSSDSAVGRKRWQSLWAMPPSLWGELCDVDMWHNGSCWLHRSFKIPAVLDPPPWHWMYSLSALVTTEQEVSKDSFNMVRGTRA